MARVRLAAFRRDLRSAASKAARSAERVHKGAAKELLTGLVFSTRVDSGKAVSNWRVGLGQPTSAVIEAHSPGRKGSTRDQNIQETLSLGHGRIDTKEPGKTVYISNNVEYQDYIPGFRQAVETAVSRAAEFAKTGRLL